MLYVWSMFRRQEFCYTRCIFFKESRIKGRSLDRIYVSFHHQSGSSMLCRVVWIAFTLVLDTYFFVKNIYEVSNF